ncbi:MAG: DUF3098 domain-containing protein [Bacteroidales bacterium]|nr:DUF3098 domain-containing protein [Bacteroidales bacterium]
MAGYSVSRKGVKMILVGLILMVSGYILMIGGGSASPDSFNYDMFDFRRLVAAPLLIIMGIVVIISSIMSKPSEKENEKDKVENGSATNQKSQKKK